MKRYACDILYKFERNETLHLLESAIGSLGFVAKYMDVFFSHMKRPLNDVSFDADRLFELFNGASGALTIKSQLYDEEKRETNNWFRLKTIVDSRVLVNTSSFEWSNSSLDFLLESKKIDTFLSFKNMIYTYCYDQYDSMDQSDELIDSFVKNYPNEPYTIIKNYLDDDVIDVSQHWGRYINKSGFTFMAAPLMWFGNEYYKIIPQKELLKFEGAALVNNPDFELVHIKLFDLYEEPSIPENRKRQKAFWKSFDLQKRADQFSNVSK